MSDFYNNLEEIEKLLEKHLVIKDLGEGQLMVNGYEIDTTLQVEMLSPAFFRGAGADNPTINAYKEFFQKMGILPKSTAAIPLIRDIPLRTRTVLSETQQQAFFAQFLENDILENQWSELFPDEYAQFRRESFRLISHKSRPLNRETVRTDEEGNALTSGGFTRSQYDINGVKLWLRDPESEVANDIEAAIERSLNDSDNTKAIVNALKPKLLAMNKIAFNVRGISRHCLSRGDIQNKLAGGGHQHFLLLDRTTNTIYAIDDSYATEEDKIESATKDKNAFRQQIQLFLKRLGDNREYKFQYIPGRSRQPHKQSYLNQPCSISQFCHYAAILAGVKVNELRPTVPPKITTLMYLLQYAYSFNVPDLFKILDQLFIAISKEQARPLIRTNSLVQIKAPIQTNSPVRTQPVSQPFVLSDEERLKRRDPNALAADEKLAYIKLNYQGHRQLITAIERLEAGSKSWNPYWMFSGYKLDCIVEALLGCKRNKDRNILIELNNPQSQLSEALNMRRLPSLLFFCCQPSPTKSLDIINENIEEFHT